MLNFTAAPVFISSSTCSPRHEDIHMCIHSVVWWQSIMCLSTSLLILIFLEFNGPVRCGWDLFYDSLLIITQKSNTFQSYGVIKLVPVSQLLQVTSWQFCFGNQIQHERLIGICELCIWCTGRGKEGREKVNIHRLERDTISR